MWDEMFLQSYPATLPYTQRLTEAFLPRRFPFQPAVNNRDGPVKPRHSQIEEIIYPLFSINVYL